MRAGIPMVSMDIRKQRIIQSIFVSTRPASLSIMKIIEPTFYPPFFWLTAYGI